MKDWRIVKEKVKSDNPILLLRMLLSQEQMIEMDKLLAERYKETPTVHPQFNQKDEKAS